MTKNGEFVGQPTFDVNGHKFKLESNGNKMKLSMAQLEKIYYI
jgi:hypothetical protein